MPIDPIVATVWYMSENAKTGNRVGIAMGPKKKVISFDTDETWEVGEEVVVTVTRRE